MKRFSSRTSPFLPALMIALLLLLGVSAPKAQAQYGANIGYQDFYDDMAPHGQWLNDPQYGYVWSPRVGRDFRPYYTNGYWAMTEYGNMWVSGYDWGWAPFHYGRWSYSDYYGWIWIPGNEWGPAWVTWRQGGGYYGWAPMGPGISINISFGSGYYAPDPWWTFIPCGNIYSRSIHRYYAPRRTQTIIRNTTIINNTYVDNRSRNTYVTGPRRAEVERVTGRKVTSYTVAARNQAGRTRAEGSRINVYRPPVADNNRAQRAAPKKATALDRSVVTSPARDARTGSSTGNEAVRSRTGVQASPAPARENNVRAVPQRTPAVRQADPQPGNNIRQQPQQPVRQQPAPQQPRAVPQQQRVTPAPSAPRQAAPAPRQQPTVSPRPVERAQPAPRTVAPRVQQQPQSRPQPQQREAPVRVERSQPAPNQERNADRSVRGR